MAHFMIDGVPIKNPTGFKIERYNVTTLERLANADMAGDLIAKKHKFYFTYDQITAAELNNILHAIWETKKLFMELSYDENGVQKKATTYVGSIPSSLYRAGSNLDSWVWQGVTFNLIER